MHDERSVSRLARPRILFLCTGNSCRSQMAEGWAKALKSAEIEAYSAGTRPHGLNPLAVRAMAEVGIDISAHTSKTPAALGMRFDVVITVCDSAHESCPVFPGARVMHVGFEDPPKLASHAANDEEAMVHYRRVRDQIREFVQTLPDSITQHAQESHAMPQDEKPCCGPSCCTPASNSGDRADHQAFERKPETVSEVIERDDLRERVRTGYAAIAHAGSWQASRSPVEASCCTPGGGGCCGPTTMSPEALAQAIGYDADELRDLPESANMGLSCGNPSALASLMPGEVVLDLGSGGGFDVFLAGRKVGPRGRAIGIDMTPAMLSKARRNIEGYVNRTGLHNVEFRLGEIEHLPVPDSSVDVVISNCVLNLSPDKPQVWREIARVLRPGGRVAVSDLALRRPLPESLREDLEALVGCIAGASLIEQIRLDATAAGLRDLRLVEKPSYVEALAGSGDPLYVKLASSLPKGSSIADYVTSLDISARR